jgi:hypothetical protein
MLDRKAMYEPLLISICTKRQEHLKKQGIKTRLLLSCVDGAKLVNPLSYLSPRSFYDFDKIRDDHRNINTIGGIGCYLSHVNAWKHVVNLDHPELILEDDATLIPGKDWRKCFSEWQQGSHQNPRIKFLQYGPLGSDVYWGAAAYMINPAAARFLVDRALPVDMHPDLFMHSVIRQHGWDFETSDGPYFTQYESNEGPFKTSVQLTDETDRPVNLYRY